MSPDDLVPVIAGGACTALLFGLAYLLTTDADRPRWPALLGAHVVALAGAAVGIATVAVYLDARS